MHVCAHIFPKSLKLTHYQYLTLHCNMLILHLYYSCEYRQMDMHSMTQVKNHIKNCILVWDFVLMWGFCHYFLFMIDQWGFLSHESLKITVLYSVQSTGPWDLLASWDAVLISSVPWGSWVFECHRRRHFPVTSNFCRNKIGCVLGYKCVQFVYYCDILTNDTNWNMSDYTDSRLHPYWH